VAHGSVLLVDDEPKIRQALSQALLDDGHRAIGLCNVAIGFQRRFAARFGVEPERVELEHVGLNHLSWIRGVRVDGVERLPEILDEAAADLGREVGVPPEIVRLTSSIPSYYLKYYYAFDKVLTSQLDGAESRAGQVMDIEFELLSMYRNPALDRKPELLEKRGGAFYSEAAAQLIASLHDGRGDVQVVDVRNGSGDGTRALPEMPDTAVVEVPARITREGAQVLPQAPLEPGMRGLVQAVKAYEELAIAAAKSGDRDVALRALVANPLVAHWSIAEPLLDALLEANRKHLPAFFPAAG